MQSEHERACPLCGHHSEFFTADKKRSYFRCSFCFGIWVPESFHLDTSAERARYDAHHNDIFNEGYRNFVRPLVETVIKEFGQSTYGLDFGAGPGPVAGAMLSEAGRNTAAYDPFFHPDTSVLNTQYDYIICIEVAEHFRKPFESFALIASLLKPKGVLYLMTDMFGESVDFQKWYYKNDSTHIFFFENRTFNRFHRLFGLWPEEIEGRVIVLRKK